MIDRDGNYHCTWCGTSLFERKDYCSPACKRFDAEGFHERRLSEKRMRYRKKLEQKHQQEAAS